MSHLIHREYTSGTTAAGKITPPCDWWRARHFPGTACLTLVEAPVAQLCAHVINMPSPREVSGAIKNKSPIVFTYSTPYQ